MAKKTAFPLPFSIGTAFAMMMFMWPPTEVVYWESIAHSLRGAMAVAVYIAYIVFNLGKRCW